ncbi:hypothetical protein BJV82DRAFT_575582 [Fennellomyces sp. T-0311]|nr:hypothetical protein BJV82DRAFT_575582 [Fennellomyces sp. T-0311]
MHLRVHRCTSLRDIIFNVFEEDDVLEDSSRDISQVQQLELLEVIWCAFRDEQVFALLLSHRQLRSLTLNQCYFITNEVSMAITTLESLEELEVVALGDPESEFDNLGAFTESLPKLQRLRKMDLLYMEFMEAEIQSHYASKSLKTALLYHCPISQAGL